MSAALESGLIENITIADKTPGNSWRMPFGAAANAKHSTVEESINTNLF